MNQNVILDLLTKVESSTYHQLQSNRWKPSFDFVTSFCDENELLCGDILDVVESYLPLDVLGILLQYGCNQNVAVMANNSLNKLEMITDLKDERELLYITFISPKITKIIARYIEQEIQTCNHTSTTVIDLSSTILTKIFKKNIPKRARFQIRFNDGYVNAIDSGDYLIDEEDYVIVKGFNQRNNCLEFLNLNASAIADITIDAHVSDHLRIKCELLAPNERLSLFEQKMWINWNKIADIRIVNLLLCPNNVISEFVKQFECELVHNNQQALMQARGSKKFGSHLAFVAIHTKANQEIKLEKGLSDDNGNDLSIIAQMLDRSKELRSLTLKYCTFDGTNEKLDETLSNFVQNNQDNILFDKRSSLTENGDAVYKIGCQRSLPSFFSL